MLKKKKPNPPPSSFIHFQPVEHLLLCKIIQLGVPKQQMACSCVDQHPGNMEKVYKWALPWADLLGCLVLRFSRGASLSIKEEEMGGLANVCSFSSFNSV